MKRLETLVIALGTFALLLVLACGPAMEAPAAAPDDARASAQEEPTPTQGPPAVEPTETPKPPLPEPPTLKPEPTRPLSTPVPTPVPGPTEEFGPELHMQPHPNGLEGCKTLNRFASLDEDEVYRPWCSLAAGDDVRTHCSGAKTAQAAKQCAYQRLADFKDYTIRSLITPCMGISNQTDRDTCIAETWEAFFQHQEDLIAVWNGVVADVDAHPDVKDHFRAMAECVREQGTRHRTLTTRSRGNRSTRPR